jgi:transcriptional regulator with XRE-family HTH domain
VSNVDLDYYEIGQRVRKHRKACDLSQEQLAQAVGISTTHMSHIETGNTKLSLHVLVSLASALSVSADALLHDAPRTDKSAVSQEAQTLLDTCTVEELRVILDIAKAAKHALRNHLDV